MARERVKAIAHTLECLATRITERRFQLRAFPAVHVTQPMIAAPEHVSEQFLDTPDIVVEMRQQAPDVLRDRVIALDQLDGRARRFEIQLGSILDILRLRSESGQYRHL